MDTCTQHKEDYHCAKDSLHSTNIPYNLSECNDVYYSSVALILITIPSK